jgi:hypothetical protein
MNITTFIVCNIAIVALLLYWIIEWKIFRIKKQELQQYKQNSRIINKSLATHDGHDIGVVKMDCSGCNHDACCKANEGDESHGCQCHHKHPHIYEP